MTVLKSLNEYGQGFQIKVLSSLLKHKEFLQNIHDVLNPDEFDNPAHKWIVKQILGYYYKYHANPTAEYLSIELKKIENDVLKISVSEQLKESFKAVNDDRDYVEIEFSNFCKNQQLKKALLDSVDLLNRGEFDEIRSKIDRALKAGQNKNIGLEYEKDIETRYRDQHRNPIATHWEKINELLMGGLGGGDLGIVFGNPGGGKSWMLVNLGAAAVANGFNVNHYTLELSQDYTGLRYDAVYTSIGFQDIRNHREEVEKVVSKLPGKLVIKEFAMGKTTVANIEAHIQKCKDLGQKPDLIIIDYVDLLKSNRKSQERKDEIDDIYTSVKGLARELNTPIWTVSQVNRAGAKDDVIEGDKAAGSYNKMMIADFAMSLSRKRQDKVNGTGRIHIMKNRYGMDGMTFSTKIDTSNGRIEVDENAMNDDELSFDNQTNGRQFNNFGSFSQEEKYDLSKKFFELSR
jgi:replicative DNA helicase